MTEKVIVIGGGVIGLASALELSVRGHEVVLLEKDTCGGQASGAAAGMLTPFTEIMEDRDSFFDFSLASLRLYPEWQKKVKEISDVYFEFTNSGSLHGVYHEADILGLETTKSWHSDYNTQVEILDRSQLEKEEPNLSKEIIAALYYPEESHIYAPDYVKAMYKACVNLGVKIFENLKSVEIVEWEKGVTAKSAEGTYFSGDTLIVCSGAWAQDYEETFGIKIPVFPIRGQICAYETSVNTLRHIVFTSQGYLVQKETGSLVCGATEDVAGFDTRVTEAGINRLKNWNPKILPMLNGMQPYHTWAGLRPATQDGHPLLGRLEQFPHIIFAVGHYRKGILLSPVTAHVVCDLVEGNQGFVPLDMFTPERFL